MSDEEKAPDSTPTLQSPAPYKVSKTPIPRPLRKLSGSIAFRFEEAMRKLDESGRRLDETRQRARDIVPPEAQRTVYPRQITLTDPEEVSGVQEDKEKI